MASLTGFTRFFNYARNACLGKISPLSIYEKYHPASNLWGPGIAGYRSNVKRRTFLPWMNEVQEQPLKLPEPDEQQEKHASDAIKEINRQITTDTTGRLFAVVHLCGTQFKVTESDIIIVNGNWPPKPGDQLKLEKVLLVGGKDFTLIGRPVLNRELISVDATVIEKTLSHTITRFRFKPRKQFRRINFYRVQRTMLRINSITIHGDVDKKKEVEGLDRIY